MKLKSIRLTQAKKMEKQRRNQRIKDGLCVCCPLPRVSAAYCEKHREQAAQRARGYARARLGIPVDWPVGKHYNRKQATHGSIHGIALDTLSRINAAADARFLTVPELLAEFFPKQ